jgi:hypothetical protein
MMLINATINLFYFVYYFFFLRRFIWMDFNSEPLSHDLLLDVLINETNQSHWLRRCIILIFGISFVIFILLLTLTLVFTKTNKQQSSSIKTVSVMMNSTTTTIPMRITSTEIKTTSKQQNFCFFNVRYKFPKTRHLFG